VSNPGEYPIGGYTTFAVSRRPDGERIVNEAHLSYSPPVETKPAPHYDIKLPDGYASWAAAWIRDTTVLWISQKDLVSPTSRRYRKPATRATKPPRRRSRPRSAKPFVPNWTCPQHPGQGAHPVGRPPAVRGNFQE
jgi:hypothetical protein